MADIALRVNSLRLRFERGDPEPSDPEIFGFMKTKMGLKSDKLLSMYKDKSEMSVIIKFKEEEDMRRALRDLPSTMEFYYNKYQSTTIKLSDANAIIRYVRLFNLPPEVDDREISAVMSKYGKIVRMVREKYAEDTDFPIWTSVRGMYMELKTAAEIPASIHVRNLRARVFYEGLVNKCFQCGSVEHLKAECPQKKTVNERLQISSQTSYSGMLKSNARWTKRQNTENAEETENKMVNLSQMFPRLPPSSKKQKPSQGQDQPESANETDGYNPNATEQPMTITTDDEQPDREKVAIYVEEGQQEDTTTSEKQTNAFIEVKTRKGRSAQRNKSDTKKDRSRSEQRNVGPTVVPNAGGERPSDSLDRLTRSKMTKVKQCQQGESS